VNSSGSLLSRKRQRKRDLSSIEGAIWPNTLVKGDCVFSLHSTTITTVEVLVVSFEEGGGHPFLFPRGCQNLSEPTRILPLFASLSLTSLMLSMFLEMGILWTSNSFSNRRSI
jgi:hypothetical protein